MWKISVPNYDQTGLKQTKCGYNFIYILKPSMTFSEPIFQKIVFKWQLFVNKSYTEYKENQTEISASDTRYYVTDGRTDGSRLHIMPYFFSPPKKTSSRFGGQYKSNYWSSGIKLWWYAYMCVCVSVCICVFECVCVRVRAFVSSCLCQGISWWNPTG
jgi:hypothetical protein